MSGDNIASLAEARTRKTQEPPTPPPQETDNRPIIYIRAGELAEIVDAADAALVALNDGLYRQGSRVIRVIRDDVITAGGGTGSALRLSQVTAPHMVERFTAAAIWLKWNERAENWLQTNCPSALAEMYLARDGNWELPFILGVVTTPTLRQDGSLIDKPGYDQRSGIVYDPMTFTFPPIPENPTKEDAIEALALLKRPLASFPFLNPASHSVALSGILTALVRRTLPTAPMHAFSAPTAGSGKSILVDVASVIATGERASVTSTGRDGLSGDVELEKRLAASMLSGDAVLSIDNLETPLGGELLCQLLTQTSVKLRVLGKSTNVDTPIATTFFATGNNLSVIGDLTRRVLISTLDVQDERPEMRKFDFHPVSMVREFRGDFVRAALIIMRAYILSKERVSLTALGSFEDWSRMVREPLVWLGEMDPVNVLEEVRKTDPRLGRLKQMMDAWQNMFGNSPKRIRDVVRSGLDSDAAGPLNPDLRDALVAITGGDKFVNAEKVAWWLRKNAGRVVDHLKFERVDDNKAVALWQLTGAAEVAEAVTGRVEPDTDIPF